MTNGESPFNHPSYTEQHPDDQWEIAARLEAEGRVDPDVAQAEFARLMEADTADAPVPLPKKLTRPILRIVNGGAEWSRHSDKPDLRPVRHMWRDRKDR